MLPLMMNNSITSTFMAQIKAMRKELMFFHNNYCNKLLKINHQHIMNDTSNSAIIKPIDQTYLISVMALTL